MLIGVMCCFAASFAWCGEIDQANVRYSNLRGGGHPTFDTTEAGRYLSAYPDSLHIFDTITTGNIIFSGEHYEPLLTIHSDGTIEVGKGVKADSAGKEFLKYITTHLQPCKEHK